MKNGVLCFGELLLRMVPQINQKWIHDANMKTYIGGSELNVSFALAKWDIPVSFVSALPDHLIASEINQNLIQNKISTNKIITKEGRLGLYYLPSGKDLKSKEVIYDRENSSFYHLRPENFDFEELFNETKWLHISAINPAVSLNVAETTIAMVKAAKALGIVVSMDLNYRKSLWQYTQNPKEIMNQILPYCDVVMGNIWSANVLAGTKLNEEAVQKKEYFKAAQSTVDDLKTLFPNIRTIALTFRMDKPNGKVTYSGYLYHNQTIVFSKVYKSIQIINRVGSGDCFMAGLIYGQIKQCPPQEIVDFCVKAALCKMNEMEDHTSLSVKQIKSFC